MKILSNPVPSSHTKRRILEIGLSGIFIYFYFLVFVYAGVSLFSPGKLSPYLSPRDLVIFLISLGVFFAVFIPWVLRELSNLESVPKFSPGRLILHSLIVFGILCLTGWVLGSAFFKPLLRILCEATLALALLPSARTISLMIIRLVVRLPELSTYGPPGGVHAMPKTPTDLFLKSSLRLVSQARRLKLRVVMAALLPEPEVRGGKNEPSPKDQILFLLEEKNRSYEPWHYVEEKNCFITTILLGPTDEPQAFVGRVVNSIKINDVWLDGARLHLPFKLRLVHGPWADNRSGDEIVLRFWMEVLCERLKSQTEEVLSEKLEQF